MSNISNVSLFVVIEGGEGSGKSTLIKGIQEKNQELGRELVITREPGGTKFGKNIREILLHGDKISKHAETLLFFADRAEHVHKVIKPALSRGAIVISDRFSYSTFAYQGYGRELSLDLLFKLDEFATGGLKPDIVFLMDIDPEIGLKRANKRAAKCEFSKDDRFEEEELEFHRRVREGFLKLAAREKERFVLLDAELLPEMIVEKVVTIIKETNRS